MTWSGANCSLVQKRYYPNHQSQPHFQKSFYRSSIIRNPSLVIPIQIRSASRSLIPTPTNTLHAKMNISSVDGQPLGPPDLPSYANYPPPHLMDGNDPSRRPRIVPVDHQYSNGQIPQSARQSPGLKRSGSVSDDGNRSRNAKAQRRHREKRKAQLRLVRLLFYPSFGKECR